MLLALVLLGPPGVGKGVLSERISAFYGIPHISSGDILREEIKKGTQLGERIKRAIDIGQYVDDEIITGMVEERVKKRDCENGFILDGYPRDEKQAEMLEEMLSSLGKKISKALLLSSPKEIIIERLSNRRICSKCGKIYNEKTMRPKEQGKCDDDAAQLIFRDDDRVEVVEKRLEVYNEKVKKLINYYKKKGLLVEIDASRGVEDVLVDAIKLFGGARKW